MERNDSKLDVIVVGGGNSSYTGAIGLMSGAVFGRIAGRAATDPVFRA